jgi:hypothetical protein
MQVVSGGEQAIPTREWRWQVQWQCAGVSEWQKPISR